MRAALTPSPADARCSEVFSVVDGGVAVRDRDRLFMPFIREPRMRVVDAVTGVVSPVIYRDLFVDTSNAMLWSDPNGAVMASSGPASVGRALPDMEVKICCFRFGVAVAVNKNASQFYLLRFDGGPDAPAVEPSQRGKSNN